MPVKASAEFSTHIAAYRRRSLVLLVFLLAFVPRLTAGLIYFHGLDDVELDLIARSVASGHGFGNAFSPTMETGPTAINPPLYVYLKAAVFRVFANDASRGRAMVFVSSLFTGLLCASWFLLEGVGLDRPTCLLAGVFSALLPTYGWLEARGTYELVLTALFAVVLTAAILFRWQDKRSGPGSAVEIGLMSGFAMLVSSSVSVIVFALLIAGFVLSIRAGERWCWTKFSAVLLVTMLAVQGPWIIRNYRVLGSPVLMRDGLGLELWVSNNPAAVADFMVNRRKGYVYAQHPYVKRAGLLEVKRIGEIQYFHDCESKAFQWIRSNPHRFLRLTAERMALFWFPLADRAWQTALRWLVSLGGFVGFIFLVRKLPALAVAIGSIWVFYPAVYYLVSANSRYTYPVYEFQLLLCAVAVSHLAQGGDLAPRDLPGVAEQMIT